MQMWAKVGLVFILAVAGLVAMQEAKGRPDVSMKCNTKGGTGDCIIENKGAVSGQVEADVVLVCHDGEHTVHLSATVEAHNHVTRILGEFTPGVGLMTTCAGIDYRNVSVK